jgi:hypothetical protein
MYVDAKNGDVNQQRELLLAGRLELVKISVTHR